MSNIFTHSALRAALAAAALFIGFSAPAQAVVYDFKKTGGGGGEPGSHLFVEVTENLTTQANDVLFKFTNEVPILNPALPPSIAFLYFDTGIYTGLFTNMSVTATFGLVNLVARDPVSHPFFDSVAPFTPEYKIGLSTAFPLDNPKNGINPGEYAVLSATLGNGYTFANVIDALHEGLSATSGLRIGEFNYFLNGTQRDDAAYVTNSVVAIPEAETWAMMLAGLCLVGFMVHRRRA